MFHRILVPVDGSPRSLNAVRFGASIADECGADLELVHVAATSADHADAHADIDHGLEAIEPLVVRPKISIVTGERVAQAVGDHADEVEGTMVVMASTGRGRSASVLGSVADELLDVMFGPLVVIGPNATEPRPLAGNVLVPVDGSKFSESSLALAGAWSIGFGGTPWVVHVLTSGTLATSDVVESSYAARLARELRSVTHHDVEYEILHGTSPARSLADFAIDNDCRLIVMSTHGRTGFDRLRMGSVAAKVVHYAHCPVLLQRPPTFVAQVVPDTT